MIATARSEPLSVGPRYVRALGRVVRAATASGALLPCLYLRARHGFRRAYGLHGGFYALDAVLTHLLLAEEAWA